MIAARLSDLPYLLDLGFLCRSALLPSDKYCLQQSAPVSTSDETVQPNLHVCSRKSLTWRISTNTRIQTEPDQVCQLQRSFARACSPLLHLLQRLDLEAGDGVAAGGAEGEGAKRAKMHIQWPCYREKHVQIGEMITSFRRATFVSVSLGLPKLWYIVTGLSICVK